MDSIRQLFHLTGQVALTTGGSRGLEEEIAQGLAEAGCSIMLVARRKEWLKPAIQAMKRTGYFCEAAVCDVTDQAQVQQAVAETAGHLGRADILVNNAGTSWSAPAEEMPLDKWTMVLGTNLTGGFLFAQAAAAHMIRAKYGRIINIASIAGMRESLPSGLHHASYVASKGGLIALTKELAAKWAQYDIRVNAIAPGYFPARLTERVIPKMLPEIKATVPMGRPGQAGELKGVAVFLAAKSSAYIAGQTMAVDGGGGTAV